MRVGIFVLAFERGYTPARERDTAPGGVLAHRAIRSDLAGVFVLAAATTFGMRSVGERAALVDEVGDRSLCPAPGTGSYRRGVAALRTRAHFVEEQSATQARDVSFVIAVERLELTDGRGLSLHALRQLHRVTGTGGLHDVRAASSRRSREALRCWLTELVHPPCDLLLRLDLGASCFVASSRRSRRDTDLRSGGTIGPGRLSPSGSGMIVDRRRQRTPPSCSATVAHRARR